MDSPVPGRPEDRGLLARVAELERELGAVRDAAAKEIESLVAEGERGRRALEFLAINERTRGWRLLNAYREASVRLRAPQRTAAPQTSPARRRVVRAGRQAPSELRFDPPPRPLVSVVLVARQGGTSLLPALTALAERTPPDLFEALAVDVSARGALPPLLPRVRGLRVVRADGANLYEARARAAGEARGKFLAFVGDRVEVQDGWLAELVGAAESSPDVGAVGSKLLARDGHVLDAGGLVWADASCAVLGRGAHPDDPGFTYRREVDFASSAALLVRGVAFARVGGFDRRFDPGGYADADLGLALRDADYRVLFEPGAVAVHDLQTRRMPEDDSVASESHTTASEVRGRHLLAVKWAPELLRRRPAGAASGVLGSRLERRPRVLVADTWVPAHDRDSGSLRMTWILRLLRELGCDVTLFPANAERREPYTRQLQRLGVEVRYETSIAQLVEPTLYDVAILSRPNVAQALLEEVRRACPSAAVVYDTVDLHFVREERRLHVGAPATANAPDLTRRVELNAMRRSDLVATVTEVEAATVRDRVSGARTAVLPNVHELDESPPGLFEARRDLVFIGSFLHDPNVDAAAYLVREIMPLVWDTIEARVWLIGPEPPPEVRQLASERTVVTGYVPDVSDLLRQARVFVAPLRYGAGMKGKIGHAMAFGLPVVTTPVGAEGMDLVDGRDVLIAERADAFAAATVDAYTDAELWARLSNGGRGLVEQRWSPDAMRVRLDRLLRELAPTAYVRAD